MNRQFPLILTLLFASFVLVGCSTTTVKSTSYTPLNQEHSQIPENQLLDVGVLNFEPGIDIARDKDTLSPEVRNAESRYFADQLTSTLQQSGAWGPVRVIPDKESVVDLYVQGTILHSDGERLELAILAWDSRNHQWLKKNYKEIASVYAYDQRRNKSRDPFQGMFNRIANDLMQIRQQQTGNQLTTIRTVSALRFAKAFSPESFDNHLRENRKGELEIVRLPATNDPILQRIERIRERDYLFVDTLQEYYSGFARQMEQPYQQWRAENYQEVIATRELKKQANARLIGGAIAVVAGIAAATSDSRGTSTAGVLTAGAGGLLIKDGLSKRQEVQLHIEALAELGDSLEADIEPHVIELEDRTITLSGNAQAQYAQWKEILQQIYQAERAEL